MSQLKIRVEHHAIDQYQVLVNGFRVAYVCVGEDKPINYLRKKSAGIQLEVAEKIAIAKFIRQAMVKIAKQHEQQLAELTELVGFADGDEICICEPVEGTLDTGKQTDKKPTPTK